MARPARDAQNGDDPAPGQDKRVRDAFELLHVDLLFNEGGIRVSSALGSIGEKLEISPRLALEKAVRSGLVERHRDILEHECVRRGPRSDEVLRSIYGRDGPPTRESLLAEASAWEEFFAARAARLEAIRESARPKEHNTASSLPAWMP
ncbi:MAG: hypothetical protein EB832_03240 [Thaumarchaeota archaeon S14]|nr:MAG: hypothetical protein EB832_03240 [Thaumarchaeota archaeon S14]